MIKIVLARHGETLDNIRKVCQGQVEGVLSERGIKENKLLADKLCDFSFEAIYTSPLQRAKQTAEQISVYHSNTPFYTDSRLMELNFGNLQGKPFPKGASPFDESFEGESFEAIKSRVKSFVDFIKSNYRDCSILVVSHGVTIKIFEHILNNKPFSIFDVQKNSTEKNFLVKND